MTKSPPIRFLLGLLVTLGAVTGLSSYSLYRLHGLRKLELNILDLYRHDSLQLQRVQNDLNAVGLKIRDMSTDLDRTQLSRYRRDFTLLKEDLNRALQYERRLMPYISQPYERGALVATLRKFWASVDEVFAAAEGGHRGQARHLAAGTLLTQQAELASQVSALLE